MQQTHLIRHASLDTKLSWPLSIYEVSGDKETGVPRDPGLRRLDGINVHREIRAAELFGNQGSDVVDLIEKLYYTDDFELANAAAAKKFDTFSNILVELRPAHTEAKGKLISAAVQAGLLDEMLLANKLAYEHLKGEWVCEPEVTWGPSEVSRDPDYRQQELPL